MEAKRRALNQIAARQRGGRREAQGGSKAAAASRGRRRVGGGPVVVSEPASQSTSRAPCSRATPTCGWKRSGGRWTRSPHARVRLTRGVRKKRNSGRLQWSPNRRWFSNRSVARARSNEAGAITLRKGSFVQHDQSTSADVDLRAKHQPTGGQNFGRYRSWILCFTRTRSSNVVPDLSRMRGPTVAESWSSCASERRRHLGSIPHDSGTSRLKAWAAGLRHLLGAITDAFLEPWHWASWPTRGCVWIRFGRAPTCALTPVCWQCHPPSAGEIIRESSHLLEIEVPSD